MDVSMSDDDQQWKQLAAIPQKQLAAVNRWLKSYPPDLPQKYPPPAHCVDVNGKEWIILLLPLYRNPRDINRAYNYDVNFHSSIDDGYLYDIQNDKLIPFIHDYEEDIYQRFKIFDDAIVPNCNWMSHSYQYLSYVIDNNDHIMYWLLCSSHEKLRGIGGSTMVDRVAKIVAFDIKDLTNIKLLYQINISKEEFPWFCLTQYTMIMVGHTIQFVLGGNSFDDVVDVADVKSRSWAWGYNYNFDSLDDDPRNYGWRHYEFDTKTKKLKLIDSNIHSKYIFDVTHSKVLNFFENLKIGDWIDARDKMAYFYLSKIVDIKDKQFDNDNKLKSMKIKVHYQDWGSQYDEWIDVSKKTCITDGTKEDDSLDQDVDSYGTGGSKIPLTTLCDCNGECHFSHSYYGRKEEFERYHGITLPRLQSMRLKTLTENNVVYSKSHKKLIILGHNSVDNKMGKFSGFYYKTINYDIDGKYNQSQLVVNGFIHQLVEKDINDLFVNIPQDIFEMIYKYYYIPNDKQWTLLVKCDKNNRYVRNMFGKHFCSHSGCVIVNNGNDIYIFGGKPPKSFYTNDIFRLNMTTNVLRRLTDIKCPPCENKNIRNWYAVFCTKSQHVHLFHRSCDIHLAISLKTLNNATSVIVDE